MLLLPLKPLTKYPHLVGSDIQVWDTFVRRFPDLFELVSYDLHVGVGLPPQDSVSDRIQKMWTTITQKRIDVIAIAGDLLFVIEIKHRPGLAALGQVLGYFALLQDYTPSNLRLVPLIVASVIEPDIESAAAYWKILYYDLSDDHNTLVDSSGSLLTSI